MNRRRAAEKEKKKIKNVAKRKAIEAGEREPDGPSKRMLRNREKTPFGAKLVIDLSFDDKMNDKVRPILSLYRVY